ncbi:MAG TPA: acyl-CoA dehydrogenase family protein [Planctomycetota bacterium]|nr:acyl-CoA dehydrogenase family protein [Planctomycetota bacterium]
MERFRGIDFLDLDGELTEEERMVRDSVRAFVDERVLPKIGACYEEGRFPTELIPEMASIGLFGPTMPEAYGGMGMGPVAYGVMCRELERGDSGVRSCASVQGSLVMYPIHEYGSEEQKKRWLPKLAKGEAIGCFGLTEPDAGSNPGGMLSRAKRDGNGWILNGRKMWITNGTVSDVSIVWAKDDGGVVRGFLVEKGAKGFTAPETKMKWSLRASVTSELVLDDVHVPDSARLPKADGLKAPLSCLTQARYGIAWGGVGAAMACLEEAVKYSKQRIVFEKPLAGFQIPQLKIADMATDLTLAQLMALRVGRLKEQGRLSHFQVSMAKRNNVAIALKIARTCRDMLGANGILLEYQSGRHLCNLETVFTYEGTHDIHSLAIGEALTGLPAYR